jgi:hypothetical protein
MSLTDNFSKKLLFFEILDLLINQIEIRFKDISSLNFLELTDSNKFDVFSRNFSEKQFNSLINNYRGFFNNERLKRELQVLYSDKLIFSNSPTVREMNSFIKMISLPMFRKYTGLFTRGIFLNFFLPQPIIHIATISSFQILKIIITESTMDLSSVSLTLKQKIFVNSKNVFLQ